MKHQEIMLNILKREPFELELLTEPLLSDFVKLIESQRYSIFKKENKCVCIPEEKPELFFLKVL